MGTIGTGQADGAAEQNPAEAWRSRNLVVLLLNGSSLGIQGGSITDASASHLHLVGRFVWTEPCVGELLQLSDSSGLPSVQQDLMVTKVLQTPDRDADGDAAADGAVKEETAAAPEAEQPAEVDAQSMGDVSLVQALLLAAQLMLRLRQSRREMFARRFLSMAASGEIARGADLEPISHRVWAVRSLQIVTSDERRQMSDLFLLHTTTDDEGLVAELRQSLEGVDTKINRLGIGRFTLTDFQKAGCPPEDLEKLRALIASAPTAAQQQAQQQEGSAAHVG